jgi:hypothetical protein
MAQALPSNDLPRERGIDAVRAAVIDATYADSDATVLESLRASICAFVREQRNAGAHAEDVVIALKRVIDVVDVRPGRVLERRALTERVVTWCIAEYYRAD